MPIGEPAIGATASAVDKGQAVPMPVDKPGDGATATWKGTASELIFADALAMCTTGAGDVDRGLTVTDARIAAVRTKMAETLSQYQALSPRTWRSLRNNALYNAKPLSRVGVSAGIPQGYLGAYDAASLLGFTATTAERATLQSALDVVAVNLCIARGVNEQMQLGATLMMTGADQRYLHATVRERAQIAMMQLADVLAVVAIPARPGDPLIIDPTARILRQFAVEGFGPSGATPTKVLGTWAEHLSDAVRLQVGASTRLAGLLARSASAREPLPGFGNQPSNDDFGEGGWRQRLLALLYGGDPLADGAPGTLPVGASPPVSGPGVAAWPTRAELPSATPGLWTARAVRLMGLLQHHNALTFALTPSANGSYASPSDIDLDKSAMWMFRDLEASLRTSACKTTSTTAATCLTVTATDVVDPIPASRADESATTLSAFRAFTNYGIRPSDARDLVSALRDVMPSTNAVTGFHIVGQTTIETLPGRLTPSLRFAPNARFVQRSLLEAAAVYGRLGRHHVPVDVTAGLAGLPLEPIYTGAADGGTGAVIDGNRLTGAMSALAALREVLVGISATTNVAASAIAADAPTLMAVVQAAIGDSHVSVRPLEERAQTAGGTAVVQSSGAPTADGRATRRWLVRVVSSGSDAFWSGRATEYTAISAADAPRIMTLLADPASQKAGFGSIDALIAGAAGGTVSQAPMQAAGSFTFEAAVSIPEASNAVVFVRRRTRTGTQYRALSGTMRLWVGATSVANAAPSARPVDGLYFATGGTLTSAASRAFAPLEWDPSRPAYDGFDSPRTDVPSRSTEIKTAGATMDDYVKRWVATADRDATTATTRLGNVVSELQRNAQEEVDVTLARTREVADTRAQLATLCGSAAGQAGTAGDVMATTAAAACDVTTMTIDASGSTLSDLGATCPASGAPVTKPALAWASSDVKCDPAAATSTTSSSAGTGASAVASVSYDAHAASDTKCALDPLMKGLSFRVELATPVACAQYAAVEPSFSPVGGELQLAMLEQRQALRGYRDAIAELDAAAVAALDRAKIADESMKLAALEILASKQRQALAEKTGRQSLAAYTQQVAEAQQATVNAQNYYAKLTGLEFQDVAKACASGVGLAATAAGAIGVGSAILAGTTVGSVVPGVGTAVGAIAGAAVGVYMALAGPSDEEVAAAEGAVNAAVLAEKGAREAEATEFANLGICRQANCPPPSPDDVTLMGTYARATTIEVQKAAMSRVGATLAVHEGVLALREKLTRVNAAASTLMIASASLRNRTQAADLNIEKSRLESRLVESRVSTNFAISQAFHAQSMWATQGLLEQSRRSASTARKAIEFAYVTDLSSLGGDNLAELQVRPPALWADQIYDYDLSSMRAVGLSDGPPPSAGIHPEKLADYMSNLDHVAERYFSAYKVNELPARGRIAYVDGPAATIPITVVDENGEEAIARAPTPGASRWNVLCPTRSRCAPSGGWCKATASATFAKACVSLDTGAALAPLSAKVGFHMDAWGQTAIAQPERATADYLNGRWARFAVNLIGTGMRDPARCNTPEKIDCGRTLNTVSFRLRSAGPFVASGADQLLHILPMSEFTARGTAYAHGTSIDPRVNTFDMPPLSVDAMRDLLGYPLEGNYELELIPNVSQDLAKVESVQILFDATFFQKER